MQNDKLLPCPFCSSNNIGYSIKTKGIRAKKYHVAMYCKDCNCYGKRTIIDVDTDGDYAFRTDVERNPEYKQIAIKSWNTREPMGDVASKVQYEDRKAVNREQKRKKKPKSVRDIAKEAKAHGMSYGKYVAQMEMQKGV